MDSNRFKFNRNIALLITFMLLNFSNAFSQDYDMSFTLSKGAQTHQIGFNGLGFLSGDFCACTFVPPGKVADYFGFQYLRDNDITGMGHNSDFSSIIGNNMLYVLDDAQKALIVQTAKAQVDIIKQYAYLRFPLIDAFVRMRDSIMPPGSPGLDIAAVKAYSAYLYRVDGRVSITRAQLYANIINSLTEDQKHYIDSIAVLGAKNMPVLPEQIDKRPLTNDEFVGVMSIADDIFSWYVGNLDSDVYFCPERQANYFGSFYLKDAPAMGNPNYYIDTSLSQTGGARFIAKLDSAQAALIDVLFDAQKIAMDSLVARRTDISELMRSYLTNSIVDTSAVLSLSETYGALDGEISYYSATNFSKVNWTLTSAQKDSLMVIRNLDDFPCDGAYLYSEKIAMPTIENSDFLFLPASADGLTVTTTVSPDNSGTILGAGIYNQGDVVVLTATPKTGYSFKNWTENGNEVSASATYYFFITSDRILVANFIANTYSVSVNIKPINSGTVTGAGDYNEGTIVTLKATPDDGYTFKDWTDKGTLLSTDTTYQFTINKNLILNANFEQIKNVTVSGNVGIEGASLSYNDGTAKTAISDINGDYSFTIPYNWSGTVVPSLDCYAFTPASKPYTNITTNKPSQDYTVASNSGAVAGKVTGGSNISIGSTSGVLTLSGHTGTVVNWQSSVSPFSVWTDIENTASTYTSGVLTETTQFRAVVQSGICEPANSGSTTVTVTPIANAGPDQSVDEGTTVTLDASKSSTTNGNVLTYLWTAPTGITLNSTTDVKLTFIAPEVSTNTNYTFSLVVNDGIIDSPEDKVVITIKQVNLAPADAGTISGEKNVCKGQNSVIYTVPTILYASSYVWILPTGATGNSTTSSITVNYGASAISGNITVKGYNEFGYGKLSTLPITVNAIPTTPTVGTITNPTCLLSTGSVVLSGLPTSGTWTLTRLPDETTITGTGSSKTISGIEVGTYTFKVTNANGCTSLTSASVVIKPQPSIPDAPTVGDITQPTCTVSTGSVVLNGLPETLTWTLTRTPGLISTTGTGTSKTITGLATGTYTYTVKNSVGCISAVSDNVVIEAQPVTPKAPTLGTITQPTCAVATGSVVLNGLPAIGSWTLTRTPGGITTSGTGESTTISGLEVGTYTYKVFDEVSGCTSLASSSAVIKTPSTIQTPPIVGIITQPTCTVATGSVVLSSLPSTGTWTLSRLPDGTTITGTGTSKTISGLEAGTYTFKVTNSIVCTSVASSSVVIKTQPITPEAPAVGTITQPTCTVSTGSVVLTGLPATLTWTLTRTPGLISTTGTGTSKTISGLATGTYTYIVKNSVGCISAASDNVVIEAQPVIPKAPTLGTITQPTCALATGSVVLNALPATGTWSLTRIPGGTISTGTGISTTISGLPTGTYTYKATNAAGCTSVASPSVVIKAQPVTPTTPVIGTITQPTGIVATGSVIVSGLPAAGSWKLTRTPGSITITGTGTTKTITGLAVGTYTYTVTNTVGCISAESDNVVIVQFGALNASVPVMKGGSIVLDGEESSKMPIAIDPIINNEYVTVYPNPTKGRVYLKFANIPKIGTWITLCNLSGKVISKSLATNIENSINLDGNPPGLYFIRINLNTQKTFKIILE